MREYRPPCSCVSYSSQMSAKCRTLPCPFLVVSTRVDRWSDQQRQSALMKSHFVKSRVIGPIDRLPRNCHRGSYTHPPSPFECRLSFHCCCCHCYCCPQLHKLLDAPFASLTLPVVRRLHLRAPVPTSVLQVVEVQVAVALAEAVTPSPCYCYCYPLPRSAQEVASPSPSGRCLLR